MMREVKSFRSCCFRHSAGVMLCLLGCIGARCAVAHGDLLERIAALTRTIERDPKDAKLYLQRAELYRLHQQWTEATADYDRAEQLNPMLTAVDLGRGKLLLDSGKRPEAKAALDKYLAREPGDAEAFIVRARVRYKLGEQKAAAKDFSAGISLMAEPQPDYYLERAQALVDAGETENALRGLEEGMKTLGPVLTLQKAALDIEVASGRYEPAFARLDTILARVTRKENWLAKKGEILVAAGRKAEAGICFKEALNAIDRLPSRIQEGQAMRDLKTRLSLVLATNAPGTAQSR
jgi:tetratricopeptide (TPR) repeat protein